MGIKSTFIDACYGRNEGHIPIWIMRQAGRYLPEYLEVRKKTTFNELCRSPELIAEVVDQPMRRFDLDAAILFSDILTMLDPMGMKFEFPDGGPVIENPISTPDDIKRLSEFDIADKMPYVFDAIRKIKEIMPDKPLIGFVGSPFTLACYLIEGKGSKNFDKAKKFIHQYPEESEELFNLLAKVIADYLRLQVDAGADTVQVFDSWGGILSRDDYLNWSAGPANKIFSALRDLNVPRVLFVNNVAPYIDIVKDVECEVIGVDYRTDISEVANALPGKSVQGNLDPSVLFGTTEHVIERTTRILESIDDPNRLIFNLGHGIQPKTPIESVQAMIDTVRKFR